MLGLGQEGMNHPWHQIPASVVSCVVGIPLFVVCLPIIAIEEAVGAPSAWNKGGNSVSKVLVGAPSLVCGYIAATPFFILGLPFEFSSSSDNHEAGPPDK